MVVGKGKPVGIKTAMEKIGDNAIAKGLEKLPAGPGVGTSPPAVIPGEQIGEKAGMPGSGSGGVMVGGRRGRVRRKSLTAVIIAGRGKLLPEEKLK